MGLISRVSSRTYREMSSISSSITSRPTSASSQKHLQKTSLPGTDQVVIQSKDGFFYEGLRKPKFANKESEVFIPVTGEKLITKKCLLIHGAIARPRLNINDTVLVRKAVGPKERPDLFQGQVGKTGKIFLYLPGIVLD